MSEINMNEEIPRHVDENLLNYTPLEKAERSKALKDMGKDYPNLPYGWLEMVYDYWKKTPKDEIEEIINKDKWAVPGKFSKVQGGTVYAMEVLDKEDVEP